MNISRSEFYRLKPFWIVHRKITGLDTCLCKPHSNMKFLIEKLYFHKLLQSMSSEKFITSLRCDTKNRLCLYGECIECKNHFVELKTNNIPTFYYQWVTRNFDRLGAKGLTYHVKIASKVRIDYMLSELVNEINLQIPRYLRYVYDTGHQFHAIENVKLSLKENEVFMVIDFYQNYVGKYANAIQSCHFGASKQQITLHTGAFYYKKKNSNEISCISFCTVSDCNRHDALSIWAHLQPILNLIKAHVPQFNTLHVQSDGPNTQYRNSTNFFLFNHHCKLLNIFISIWHFTTAGHGKSIADGIGGTVKNLNDRYVAQGNDVTCASDVVNTMKSSGSQIKVFLIEEADVKKINEIIANSTLKPAPNTIQVHNIIWTKDDEDTLYLNYLSCSYCICNKLYYPPCSHFSLPTNWTVKRNVCQKNKGKSSEAQYR